MTAARKGTGTRTAASEDPTTKELSQDELLDEAVRAHRAVNRLAVERHTEVANRRAALAELVERFHMTKVALGDRLGVAPQRIGQMIQEGR